MNLTPCDRLHPLFWDPLPDNRIDLDEHLLPQGLLFSFHPNDTVALTPNVLRTHWRLISRSTNHVLQGELEDSATFFLSHKLNVTALYFRRMGLATEATKMYQVALSMRPEYPITRNNYGALLLSQGELSRALEQLNVAYDYNPLTPQVNKNIGKLLLRLGDPAQATHFFEKALAFGATEGEVYALLGEAYAKTGRFSLALNAMQSALAELARQTRQNPGDESAHKLMASLQTWIHYIESQQQVSNSAR